MTAVAGLGLCNSGGGERWSRSGEVLTTGCICPGLDAECDGKRGTYNNNSSICVSNTRAMMSFIKTRQTGQEQTVLRNHHEF